MKQSLLLENALLVQHLKRPFVQQENVSHDFIRHIAAIHGWMTQFPENAWGSGLSLLHALEFMFPVDVQLIGVLF
jgi:hypothetical protein